MFAVVLLLAISVVQAAAKVYTGFTYGAFWSEQSNVKRYADFYYGFQLAKNLTNTPVPFDSARLFTCITTGTKNDPTEAFQAAIDTSTHLMLGMWVSPGSTRQSNDAQVENELAALEKAFEQYGQKLADLVIGLSVGSEDVYRFNSGKVGLTNDDVMLAINSVREKIAASQFARYMQGKPIGHTDTAPYSVIPGLDFAGMNAYPFWEGKHINDANVSFMSALEDTQRRAGNTPVWITELGWPIVGTQVKDAVASPENYQRYWSEVGCQVFGKYNTFWFELLQDSQPEQPDWGLLDTKTYQARIKNLSCGAKVSLPTPPVGTVSGISTSFSGKPVPTTFSTVLFSVSSLAHVTLLSETVHKTSITKSTHSIRTTHVTQTITTEISPATTTSAHNEELLTVYMTTTTYIAASQSSSTLTNSITGVPGFEPKGKTTVCIAMMDLMGDGVFMPVVTYAADISTCLPPPRFTGSPFTMIAGPKTTPAKSLSNASACALRTSLTTSPTAPTLPPPISLPSTSLAGSATSGHSRLPPGQTVPPEPSFSGATSLSFQGGLRSTSPEPA